MQMEQRYLDEVRDVLDSVAREHATTLNPEYCFDSIIDEGYARIAIKASQTIDNVEAHVREELYKICSILRCTPLIIGERTRKRPLQDGVVHTRGSISAITLETLRRILEEHTLPFLQAKKGGVYVLMDGDKMKSAREAGGYSRGDIAERMGLSRRAIYEYERGTMNPTIDVALRLEELLDTTLIEPLNLFGTFTTSGRSKVTQEPLSKQTKFIKTAVEVFSRLGFNSTLANDAPFNLLNSLRQHVILSYLKQRLEHLDEERIDFLAKLADVLNENPVIIASESATIDTVNGIPVVDLKELLSLHKSSEFIALIQSRRGA